MNKILFPVAAAAMTVAVVLSSPTLAQDVQKGIGGNMPAFADFDLNGDGAITEDEFNKARSERIVKRAQEGRQMKNVANASSFQDIDADDNGSISPDEFTAHQAEHRAKRAQH